MGSARILIAEDDRSVRTSLQRILEFDGYDVTAAPDGLAALEALDRTTFDLVILDWMMPGADGVEVCRRIRSDRRGCAVLFLTAKVETSDRVAGLDAGADDYLPKPFDIDELTARVRALLRRWDHSSNTDTLLHLDDLVIDEAGRQARRSGVPLELTKIEFDLLCELVRNAGATLTPAELYERIWGADFPADSRNLTVYIGYLRRKLEQNGRPRLLHTVRGVGYVARA